MPVHFNDLLSGSANSHLDLAQRFSEKLFKKAITSLKADIAATPSIIQMHYYFSDLDGITCPISSVATVNPVKLKYEDSSSSKQVFDGVVISKIIETKEGCPLTRREITDYISVSTLPFIEEFNEIASKTICKKSDISEEDKKIVSEFIDNYLVLNLDPENIVVNGCNLLYIAAKFGLPKQVKTLLDMKMDPNQSQGFSHSSDYHFLPLCVCATLGHADVAQELLSHSLNPAFVNATPDNGEYAGVSSAYFAARYAHIDMLKVLVEHKADFTTHASYQGLSGLYVAVLGNDFDTVKEITKSENLDIDRLQLKDGGNKGLSALYLATHEGHVETVKLLLDRGADPMLKQGEGEHEGKTVFDINLDDNELDLKIILADAKSKIEAELKAQAEARDRAEYERSSIECQIAEAAKKPQLNRVISFARPLQGSLRPRRASESMPVSLRQLR